MIKKYTQKAQLSYLNSYKPLLTPRTSKTTETKKTIMENIEREQEKPKL